MLPNLRVAVAAVLAGLLLIVTAFGLAATVRIAQNAKTPVLDPPHQEKTTSVAAASALTRTDPERTDEPAPVPDGASGPLPSRETPEETATTQINPPAKAADTKAKPKKAAARRTA